METAYSSRTTKPLYRGSQIVWYLLGVVEAFLAFRFVLKLLAANPGAGFTSFVYAISDVLALPFRAVFGTTRVEGSIFEWPTLLAMAVYWLIAWAIIKLFFMSRTVSTPEAASKLEQGEPK